MQNRRWKIVVAHRSSWSHTGGGLSQFIGLGTLFTEAKNSHQSGLTTNYTEH